MGLVWNSAAVLEGQHVVCIVGPDSCGKTHIAYELSKQLMIPYFKNKGEWTNFRNEQGYFVNCMKYGDLGMFSQFLVQTHTSVVLDRSWPCEKVYSKVFGRETDHDVLKQLDDVYHGMNALIVIAYRSDYSNVTDELFSDIITHRKLKQLHDEYMEFAKWTKCRTLFLNVDDEDLDREVKEILVAL